MTVVPLDQKRSAKPAPEEAPASTPWSGEFSESALLTPGAYLIAALERRAEELGHTLVQMTKRLGVTYGYFNLLRKGERQISQISAEVSAACAAYLGVPRLMVLALAGIITPQDLFESSNPLEAHIPRAMEFIRKDPEWQHLVTEEAMRASFETRFLIVRLYEAATHLKLLPESLDISRFAEEFVALQAIRAERMKILDAAESKSTES